MGQISAFYSYKGGGGRSMAVANVSWALASNDQKVLAIDWDFEAPGLHRYFHPFLSDPEQSKTLGLIDRLWGYVDAVAAGKDADDALAGLVDLSDITQPLDLPRGISGKLDFIGAGRQDASYTEKVGGFDWRHFYEEFGGGEFFDAVAKWAKDKYDVILIDSRTGVSDSAGVCTVQLPDVVVLNFIYNRQSVEGTASVARSILRQRQAPIRLIPSPARVEDKLAAATARRYAAHRFRGVFDGPLEDVERELRRSEIPHYSWCAFEEKLAVFEEDPDDRGLLQDMHSLAGKIIRRPIKPVRIDHTELDRLWRRAAFADPRLADLKLVLSRFSVGEAISRLREWLSEALDNQFDRADWIAALAAACVESTQSHQGSTALAEDVDLLSTGGVDLARRLVSADPDNSELQTELGRLLLLRAHYLQTQARPEEALDTVAEATRLLKRGSGPTGLLLAKALEWQAGVVERAKGPAAAVSLLGDVHEIYRRLSQEDRKFVEEATRTLIDIAALQLDAGNSEGAIEACQEVLGLDVQADESYHHLSFRVTALSIIGRACIAVCDFDQASTAVSEAKRLIGQRKNELPAALRAELGCTRAELLFHMGRPVEARSEVDDARALLKSSDSSNLGNMRLLARLAILRIQTLKAEGDLQRASVEAEAALGTIGEIEGLQQQRVLLYQLVSDLKRSLGDSEAADEAAVLALIRALEAQPQDKASILEKLHGILNLPDLEWAAGSDGKSRSALAELLVRMRRRDASHKNR